jgi:energy-coupling factor transporter transmembrane protein EcfT
LSSFKNCLTKNTPVCWFLFLASTHFLFSAANRFFSMSAYWYLLSAVRIWKIPQAHRTPS